MQDHSKSLADTMAILEFFQGLQLAMVMDIVAQAIQADIAMAKATLEDEFVELVVVIDGQVVELAINPVPKFA